MSDIVLPRRAPDRPFGGGGREKPNASSVRTVGAADDPGVSVPLIQSTAGNLATELQPAIDTFERVLIKQQNRNDTIARAGGLNEYEKFSDDLTRKTNLEGDFSDKGIATNFGTAIAEQKGALLQAHIDSGASNESIALYEVRLGEIEAKTQGRAAVLSAEAGRTKATKRFNAQLVPIADDVYKNPTRNGINEGLLRVESLINNYEGAFTPGEQEEKRASARELVSLNAYQSYFNAGHFEAAESLLDDDSLSGGIDAQKKLQLRGSLRTAGNTKSALQERVDFWYETHPGQKMSQRVAESLIGLVDKESEREMREAALIKRDFPPNLAADLAAGDVHLSAPDNLGNVKIVNTADGTYRMATQEEKKLFIEDGGVFPDKPKEDGGQESQPSEAKDVSQEPQSEAEEFTPEEEQSIEEAVLHGTGIASNIAEDLSNFFGVFFDTQIAPDNARNRQRIRIFAKVTAAALTDNPKFPQGEMELVRKLMADPDKFFIDPKRAAEDMAQMRAFLIKIQAAKQKEFDDATITTNRKGELADQISRIEEVKTLMGPAPKFSKSAPQDRKHEGPIPKGIPEESKFLYNAENGDEVWEAPDGGLFGHRKPKKSSSKPKPKVDKTATEPTVVN